MATQLPATPISNSAAATNEVCDSLLTVHTPIVVTALEPPTRQPEPVTFNINITINPGSSSVDIMSLAVALDSLIIGRQPDTAPLPTSPVCTHEDPMMLGTPRRRGTCE